MRHAIVDKHLFSRRSRHIPFDLARTLSIGAGESCGPQSEGVPPSPGSVTVGAWSGGSGNGAATRHGMPHHA